MLVGHDLQEKLFQQVVDLLSAQGLLPVPEDSVPGLAKTGRQTEYPVRAGEPVSGRQAGLAGLIGFPARRKTEQSYAVLWIFVSHRLRFLQRAALPWL